MKEASGELSMTAITVVAIAAIAGLFTVIILPVIRNNIKRQAYCTTKFNCDTCSGGQQTCSYIDKDDSIKDGLVCPCEE